MTTIKLKRGLDIKISGKATLEVGTADIAKRYSIVPDHFEGITPKVVVKAGEHVKAGQPLFHDKMHEEINVVSPVSGIIEAVNRGERRKVMSIDITPDAEVEHVTFDTKATDAQTAKALLLQSGMWVYIKQRPYDVIANPDATPKAIFISTFDTAPLAADFNFTLAGHQAELQAAIDTLAMIAPVYVGVNARKPSHMFDSLKNCTITAFDGPHPAGNVGVQINHVAPVNKGETVYTIGIQDLAIIGRLIQKGHVDMQKTIALCGPLVRTPQYYKYTYGQPASCITRCNIEVGVKSRIICGNILSGTQIDEQETLCPYCNQISVIADGSDTDEILGWVAPRINKFSTSGTYLSGILGKFMPKIIEYEYDARLLGGRRAIIMSGEYDKVFPMDIYPEYLIKAMIAGNIDRMEALGAYEVAPEDFALCEFVCTSKMPLQAIVRQALSQMRKELE